MHGIGWTSHIAWFHGIKGRSVALVEQSKSKRERLLSAEGLEKARITNCLAISSFKRL